MDDSQEGLSEWLKVAKEFIVPIFTAPEQALQESLVSRLTAELPCRFKKDTTSAFVVGIPSDEYIIIEWLSSLLSHIHTGVKRLPSSLDGSPRLGIEDIQIINKILDVLTVYGIYSCISPGVGIPLDKRVNSSYLAQMRNDAFDLEDDEKPILLLNLMLSLKQNIEDAGEVGEIVKQKMLVDIVAGLTELAFNPAHNSSERQGRGKELFSELLEKIDIVNLLPILVSLNHPRAPLWLKAVLTHELSQISMRPDKQGVRCIIEFIVQDTRRPNVSIQKLDQVAYLVGAIPRNVPVEIYFETISRQVIPLLDHVGVILPRASAHIISKLQTTYPVLTDKYIFQPLRSPILPSSLSTNDILTTEQSLETALHRLAVLISSHPNPQFPSLLLKPLLLPLYALAMYARETSRRTWQDRAEGLIGTFVKTSSTPEMEVERIIESLLFDGREMGWRFSNAGNGGIEIVSIKSRLGPDEDNGIEVVEKRVEGLTELVGKLDLDVGMLTELFVYVVRAWLSGKNINESPWKIYGLLKLLQTMLLEHQDKIITQPRRVIEIIKELLDQYVCLLRETRHVDGNQRNFSGPKLETLVNIVKEEDVDIDGEDEEQQLTVRMAIGLLSALLGESENLTIEEEKLLQTLQPSLEYISTRKDNQLNSLAANLDAFITARVSFPSSQEKKTTAVAHLETPQEIYSKATRLLHDDLIPVKAHGITLLRDLIATRPSSIDPLEILQTMINLLKEEDSYIYLNVIKSLAVVADVHGEVILKRLLQEYADGKKSVDERLRVGEALNEIIKRLGELLTGQVANDVGAFLSSVVEEDQDWRLRTSSIGLLGVAIETNARGMALWLDRGVDMAVHVLNVNRTEQDIPLRRAAMTLLGSILNGVRTFTELPVEKLKNWTRSVRYIEGTDADDLVRVQARGVLGLLGEIIINDLGVDTAMVADGGTTLMGS